MKSGCKIVWTDNALAELEAIYAYLELKWTEKELVKFSIEIERTLRLISSNPKLFPKTERGNIRRAIVLKLNTLYYRQKDENSIEILSFFANRKKPGKIKS